MMTDPNNKPSGIGGLDMEPIWELLFFITLIAIIIAVIYIIYLKHKLDKYEEQENKQEE